MRKSEKKLRSKLQNIFMIIVILASTLVTPVSAVAETINTSQTTTQVDKSSVKETQKENKSDEKQTEKPNPVKDNSEADSSKEEANGETSKANDSPLLVDKEGNILGENSKTSTYDELTKDSWKDIEELSKEELNGSTLDTPQKFEDVDFDSPESILLAINNENFEFLSFEELMGKDPTHQFENYMKTKDYFISRYADLIENSKTEVSTFARALSRASSGVLNARLIESGNAPYIFESEINQATSVAKFTIGSQVIFCIQWGVPAGVGLNHTVNTNLAQLVGDSKAKRLTTIGELGWYSNSDKSDDQYIATQIAIWIEQGAIIYNYSSEWQPRLQPRVSYIRNNHSKLLATPSFNGQIKTVKEGETAVFKDTSNSLSFNTYVKSVSKGTTAVIKGDNLEVTTSKDSPNTVSVVLGKGRVGANSAYFQNGNWQKLATLGYDDPNNSNVRINVLKQGNFVLDKVDDNDKPLEGVKFNIKVGSNPVKEYTTNAQGKITIKDIDVDTTVEYEETSSPVNYYIDKDTYKGSVIIKPNIDNVVKVKNPRAYGQVSVEKQDAETGDKAQSTATLVGGEYTLYNDKKEVVETKKTGDNRKATFNNLSVGTYFIKETKAPNGYYLDDPTEYEVKVTHEDKFDNFLTSEIVQTSEKGKNPTALFKNHPQRGDFELIKVDEKGKPMENVKFDIVTKVPNGATSEKKTYVTDKNGKITIKKLLLDTVVEYEEIETNVNYYIDKDTYKGSVIVKPDTTNSITVKNPRAYGSFEIEKQDKETNTKPQGDATLVGGEYTLYDDSMKAIETKKTDENRKTGFEKLSVGTYFVKETKAPTGYNLDAPLFTVKVTQPDKYSPLLTTAIYDGTGKEISKATSGTSTIFFNTVIRGDVELKKWADADWKNDIKNIIALKGAVFGMFDKDGKKVDEQTTDANGVLTFKNHPYGDYTVKELKAPEGYMIVASHFILLKLEFIKT